MFKNFKKIGSSGTTMIELLVSISIFAIFITISSQLLAMALKEHQKSLEKAELLNQASYALEYMNRALRMAQKDLSGNCITQNFNYENLGADTSVVRFINYQGRCTEFSRQNKLVMIRKSTNDSHDSLGEYWAVTSAGLSVENLHFLLNGQSQSDSLQSSVCLAMKIKGRTATSQEIQIQSTVSQRQLDVQY